MAVQVDKSSGNVRVSKKRRFVQNDADRLAERIHSEQARRERERGDTEKTWDEVDRQIAQKPDIRLKMNHNGSEKAWMPTFEPPLQAQTLEVLTADARRMLFTDTGKDYFQPHVVTTDDYLNRVDFESLIAGDDNDTPATFDQDDADQLLKAFHEQMQNQYDFLGHWDQLNAEAFKYGTFAGRAVKVKKSVFQDTNRGIVRQETEIPVLVPKSIRNVYLDDRNFAASHTGRNIGPTIHLKEKKYFDDLVIQARKGSPDPNNPDGGWRLGELEKLEEDSGGEVTVIEAEGDIVVPRKQTRSFFLPNSVATIAFGDGGKPRLIRLRFTNLPFNSWLTQPYHLEKTGTPYGAGPLMKAMPIQKVISESMVRLMVWAALNVEPPLKYDPSDIEYARNGGPKVFPGALWNSLAEVDPVEIGDGAALLNILQLLLKWYEDLTGVNAPRLGAQTVSHTTAFAKDAELQRGTIRTVDYVRSVMSGALNRWLHMEFELGKSFSRTRFLLLRQNGAFAEIESKHLPDSASYEVFGSGGPAQDAGREQRRLAAVQLATQLEVSKVQLGKQPSLDLEEIQKQVLSAEFPNSETFFRNAGAAIDGAAGVQPALTSSSDPISEVLGSG